MKYLKGGIADPCSYQKSDITHVSARARAHTHSQRHTCTHIGIKRPEKQVFFCFYLDESKAKYCHNANFDLKNKTRNWGFSCLQEFLK